MEVECVDFGKERRDSSRILARLLRVCDEQEEELRRDPVKLFAQASEEICRLHELLRNAQEALYGDPVSIHMTPPIWPDTVTVTRRDYSRWRACEDVLNGVPDEG